MKWLFLILLISCGHQEPSGLDLQDDDGDLVANAYEAGSARYIAEFKQMPNVVALLRVNSAGVQREFKLTNKPLTREEILKALGTGTLERKKEHFFHEQTTLQLEKPVEFTTAEDFVRTELHFDLLSDKFHSIDFMKNGERVVSSPWQREMSITLSKEIISGLLKGEIKLDINRTEQEAFLKDRIKSRTYRVLMSDGEETRAFYVSQELPFTDFLKEQNLLGVARDLLRGNVTRLNELGASWWYRSEANDHEKVLFYGEVPEVTASYLAGLPSKKDQLARVDGQPQSTLALQSSGKEKKKVFLRIRPGGYRHRIFSDKVHDRSGGGGGNHCGGGEWSCVFTTRNVAGENSYSLTDTHLRENLMFWVDGEHVPMDKILRHFAMKSDALGVSWEMSLEITGQEFKMGLLSSRAGNNVQGIISTDCGKYVARVNTTPISIESYFGMQVEAYLEK